MNLLDLIIMAPILLFAIQGYRNGIVREVLTIVGVIVAVLISFRYMDELGGMLGGVWEQSEQVILLVSWLILFTAVLVLTFSLSMLLGKFLEWIRLSKVNRLFGFVFGGLKAALVISAVLLVMAGVNLPAEETRKNSLTYPFIIHLAPAAVHMTSSLFPGTGGFMNQIEQTLDEFNPIQNLTIFNSI